MNNLIDSTCKLVNHDQIQFFDNHTIHQEKNKKETEKETEKRKGKTDQLNLETG
jgi:hypothetical protein